MIKVMFCLKSVIWGLFRHFLYSSLKTNRKGCELLLVQFVGLHRTVCTARHSRTQVVSFKCLVSRCHSILLIHERKKEKKNQIERQIGAKKGRK